MIVKIGYNCILMWLVTTRNVFTNSTDCAIILGINYGDVGHVTTLTNHITAYFRTSAGSCAISTLHANKLQLRCHSYMTQYWCYDVVTLIASYK